MVARGGVFIPGEILPPPKVDVTVEEQIAVEVQQFFERGEFRHEVGEQAQEGVGRAVGALVRTAGEFPSIEVGHVEFRHGVVRAERLDIAVEKGNFAVVNGEIGGVQVAGVHGHDPHVYRLPGRCAAEHRDKTGENPVKHFSVPGKEQMLHGC